MSNIDMEQNELLKTKRSLYIDDNMTLPYFWLNKENRELVFKYIDQIDLSELTLNDEIKIFVSPIENNVKTDWAKFLNSITNKGYNINFIICTLDDTINQSIEAEDIIKDILKCSDEINNKDNIKFGYAMQRHEMDIKKYQDIDEVLDLCANDINEKNFSPLEKLVAACKVTIGMFLGLKKDISTSVSYDKYSSIVLFPNTKPMDQSYTQIFEALCQRLNIKCFYKTVLSNHSADIVEITDEKYNVRGRYFIDISLAAYILRAHTNDRIMKGKSVNDNLEIEHETFCIGYNEMKEWVGYYPYHYESEHWKKMKLSDNGIPKEILEEAICAVNEACVINTKVK